MAKQFIKSGPFRLEARGFCTYPNSSVRSLTSAKVSRNGSPLALTCGFYSTWSCVQELPTVQNLQPIRSVRYVLSVG